MTCRRRPAAYLVLAALVAILPAVAVAQSSDYIVGAQDVLTIAVWDQPDMSGKFAVEADGTFTFPLIGRVKAGGLTLRQVEEELRKRLADGYFRNPQITVAVELYRSQRIFIVGEARTPGTYPLTGDMTLIEALARAGSTTPSASGEAIIVRARPDSTGSTRSDGSQAAPRVPGLGTGGDAEDVIRVELKALQSGALSQNVSLRDGDTIYIPRAESIYVFGQVRSPGAYALQSKDTTVLQALSVAGGVTDRGSTARIKIVRIVKGEKKEIKVRLTDIVRPGDTIIVPERFF